MDFEDFFLFLFFFLHESCCTLDLKVEEIK